MFHTYVMGIDDSIWALEQHGFVIQKDWDNFTVAFPEDKAELWENFIREHLEVEYWNEYLTEEFFAPDYFDYIVIDDERVIIRTKLEKPSKIKGLALI